MDISLAVMRDIRLVSLVAVVGLLGGCTNISCWYGAPDPGDVAPEGYPVGLVLAAKAPLVGLLDESIDNKQIHYLNLVEPPGYRNRFVKARVPVEVGARFTVLGYRKPHNPICYGHDWKLVLGSRTALTPARDEINISVPVARSNMDRVAE